VLLTRDPMEAADGADVVTTDVWASMGQEEEAAQRMRAFQRFQVDASGHGRGRPNAIFLHCLPAHTGEEVSEEVFEGSQARVWNEAENRLHVQKAILIELMGERRWLRTRCGGRLCTTSTCRWARMVPFAGFEMPVQYPAGIVKEHMAVRTQRGCSMSRIWASSRSAAPGRWTSCSTSSPTTRPASRSARPSTRS
jgi:hypothetical protein